MLAGALFLGCNEPTGPLSLPAAVGRPAEASQGPRVGVIVARGGEVTIVPSKGQGFPGLPEQQLLRDDKLVTAANSFVVVQLHNGHLVRLGASQSNVVEMLAPFHDPPAGNDVEARFVRLLTPAERDDPTLSGAITRVAGWNTRMSASESFAALPAAEASRAPAPIAPPSVVPASDAPSSAAPALDAPGAAPSPETEEAAAPRHEDAQGEGPDGAAQADAKMAPPRSTPKPPSAPAKIEGSRKPADAGGAADHDDEATSKKDKSSSESAESPGAGAGEPAPASPVEPSPAQLPSKLKFSPASGGAARMLDLPTPLKAGAAALAKCAGVGAKIFGSVKDHKLVALKVDGKIKCQELVGKASSLDDGSFELTVTP